MEGVPRSLKWEGNDVEKMDYERKEMVKDWEAGGGNVDCIFLYESDEDDGAVGLFRKECEKIQKRIDEKLAKEVEADEEQAELRRTRRDSVVEREVEPECPKKKKSKGRTEDDALRAMEGELKALKVTVRGLNLSEEDFEKVKKHVNGMSRLTDALRGYQKDREEVGGPNDD